MQVKIILAGSNGIIGASENCQTVDKQQLLSLIHDAWKKAEWDSHTAEIHLDGKYLTNQDGLENGEDFSLTVYRGIYHLSYDDGNAEIITTNINNLRIFFK